MKALRKTADALEEMALHIRREAVVELREEAGLTFEAIGDQLGISRQRAHALYLEARPKEAAV